jgi:hypothetical protein
MRRATEAIRSFLDRSPADARVHVDTRGSHTPARSRMPTTSVNLSKLGGRAAMAADMPKLLQRHLLQKRLDYARGIAAVTERDPVPPASAEIRFGDAGRVAMKLIDGQAQDIASVLSLDCASPPGAEDTLQDLEQNPLIKKKDKTHILLLCALRTLRLTGLHCDMKPEEMAPLKVQRQMGTSRGACVSGKYQEQNSTDRAVNHMFINLHQNEWSEKSTFSAIIAHETTHEKQFSRPYVDVSALIQEIRDMRTTPVPDFNRPRGVFHQTTKLPGSSNKGSNTLESDSYHTNPIEIGAYGVQTAFMQHEWTNFSNLEPLGFEGDRSILLDMLSKIGCELICDAKAAEEKPSHLTDAGLVYTAEFTPDRIPAYKATGEILLHLSDLEKMQDSCRANQVAQRVHGVFQALQRQLQTDQVACPTQDLQTIAGALKILVKQLKQEHGTYLLVPACIPDEARDAERFKSLHNQPLALAKITAIPYVNTASQEKIEIQSQHVDAVLENSGFNHAVDEFRLAMNSDQELTHDQLLKPITELAQYIFGAKIPRPALNVYDAFQPTVAHVDGLNSHGEQEVKIRFDPAHFQIHIPRHSLDVLARSPGPLAKIGMQVASMLVSAKNNYPDDSGMPDPGLFLESIHHQMVSNKLNGVKNLIYKYRPAPQVTSPSNDISRQVFAAMVGASTDQYRFEHHGNYLEVVGYYHGPQKPSAANHWHTYGDRAVAKSMMNDPKQSPPAREAAALAYRAGVLERKAQDPFLAVMREFALRANARVA